MATSTCIKCGGHTFENAEVSPQGSRFKLSFVQCASCGGVVGVMDWYNIGAEMQSRKKEISAVGEQLGQIEHDLHLIKSALKR